MWGIGKAKAVKVRLPGCKLLKMGNTEMPMDEVLLEATQFVARCYGYASSESMSATRYEVWIGKTSMRIVLGAPKLKSLPPSPEAFEQNVRRAHFQFRKKTLQNLHQQTLAGKRTNLRDRC